MQISPAQLINVDNYERVQHINRTLIYTHHRRVAQLGEAATFVNIHVYANARHSFSYFYYFHEWETTTRRNYPPSPQTT